MWIIVVKEHQWMIVVKEQNIEHAQSSEIRCDTGRVGVTTSFS